jgi:uncharacterized membrane protein YdjX (TVP38/TMEM64 family)
MQQKFALKNWLPLIIITSIAIIFFLSGAYKYFSFTFIRGNILTLNQFVAQHLILSSVILVALYTICTSIPTPLPGILTMLSGYFFGVSLAICYCCVGEAIGGWVLFKAIQTSFGQRLFKSSSPKLITIKDNIKNHATIYLCFFRFSCVTPSWLINLVAGLSLISNARFLTITFLATIPSAFIYSTLGKNLIKIINTSGQFSHQLLLKSGIIIPILSLLLLFFLGVIINAKITKNT